MENITVGMCTIKADRAVLSLTIDKQAMLVFYSPQTRKFSGVLINGDRFSSSDRCAAKWFKRLDKFLGEIC